MNVRSVVWTLYGRYVPEVEKKKPYYILDVLSGVFTSESKIWEESERTIKYQLFHTN